MEIIFLRACLYALRMLDVGRAATAVLALSETPSSSSEKYSIS